MDDRMNYLVRDFVPFGRRMNGDRDTFVRKVKEMCIERQFRVRMPYADRFDSQGKL